MRMAATTSSIRMRIAGRCICFGSLATGWNDQVSAGLRGDAGAIPPIVRGGTNNGAWFANRHLWIQNEDTAHLPDGVDRRSFNELLGDRPARAKSPAAALGGIEVPEGFEVQLVAVEPLVADPVDFDWGPDGRLWVVEMADYPLGIDGQGKPGGRVRCLQDTDGDGVYDRSTLFLDRLNTPTGILVWRNGVLITAAPDVIYAEDTDGDGRADRRETLFTGFGQGNQQHRVNGLRWGAGQLGLSGQRRQRRRDRVETKRNEDADQRPRRSNTSRRRSRRRAVRTDAVRSKSR